MRSQALFPITFNKVCLMYGKKRVLDHLSLEVGAQGITAIMGPNGAGKSLCLRVMAGLVKPSEGEVLYGGQNQNPAGQIGFVFQSPVLLRRSVLGNLIHALKVAGVPSALRNGKAQALLQKGLLQAHANTPARKLSGGEQQRLALIRALASNPSVLFLDEPSASLDPHATALIERMVREVSAQGVKIILVTHDQGQAKRLSDEVIFLHQGRNIESNITSQFLNDPTSRLAKAYLKGELLINE
ncbi:MAG: ATP-binding cassette domain-containing protein [Limnobacter sp.]|nr:ATP-binding cassette domain-containing protein [Limnobacter sp.]